MFVSKRTLRRAGVAAALSLALAVPAAGVAQAAPSTTTVTHATNAAKQHARVALKVAVTKAAAD